MSASRTRLDVERQDGDAPLPPGFDALVAACARADDHAPFGEHTLLTLHGTRSVRHARVAVRLDGALAGFAVLSEGLDAWYLELAVSPYVRRLGVGRSLVDVALNHVASHGGGTVRAWAHSGGEAVERLADERLADGWHAARTLLVLDRPLHPGETPPGARRAVPPGLVLRDLDPAADRDAWLALSNAAFAGHPENGGWTRADLDWRLQTAWTHAHLFPVLADGAGLVAGVWCKAEPGSRTGELYAVAVAPRCQGQGLGAVVVGEALRRLAADGRGRALLYVDSTNAAARRVYDRAGFGLHHVDRCWERTV